MAKNQTPKRPERAKTDFEHALLAQFKRTDITELLNHLRSTDPVSYERILMEYVKRGGSHET